MQEIHKIAKEIQISVNNAIKKIDYEDLQIELNKIIEQSKGK